jgi:hypothetical protein
MISCLFSCEHATCAVPEAFREVFKGSEDIVASTKGWDPGALNLAQGFSMKFRTPLIHGDVTRLLIDLNEEGDLRWSNFSGKLPEATQTKLTDRHERPYRLALNNRINDDLARNHKILHLMLHTEEGGPELVLEIQRDGFAREAAEVWRATLAANGVEMRVTKIEGSGLMARLTETYPGDRYGLMRLKVPQSYFLEGKPLRWETLKKFLLTSLPQVVAELEEKVEAGE